MCYSSCTPFIPRSEARQVVGPAEPTFGNAYVMTPMPNTQLKCCGTSFYWCHSTLHGPADVSAARSTAGKAACGGNGNYN
jgi:hypothetical protein